MLNISDNKIKISYNDYYREEFKNDNEYYKEDYKESNI